MWVVDCVNVRDRLEQLMNQQGISAYKLSQDSGVSWNTIHNILKKDINPTVQTLEKLCKGFGISLVQFFDVEGAAPQISAEQQRHLNKREMLCERDRRIIDSMIDSMLNDK